MSGGGKPPPAPDYIGAAREQGKQNIEALRIGAALNRVNQIGPYGSTTYEQDPTNPDRWTQITQLTPNQQALLAQSEANQLDLGRIASLRLGDVGSQGAFSLDNLIPRVTNVQQSNFTTDVGLPAAEQRQRAEDAIYRSATRYLDPQFEQREQDTRARLINAGVREGSEAWNREMANLERDRQAAYGDAIDRAIMGGGMEASRMLSDDLSRAGFVNQAEAQRFAQALQNAQLANMGRSAQLEEMLLERQLPLQEFLQMYSGYSAPLQAPSIPNVGSPQPVDYMGAIGAQYGAQADAFNFRQAQNAQNQNALLNLAAMLFLGL